MADNIWKYNKCNIDVYTKSNTVGIKSNNNVRFTHPKSKKKSEENKDPWAKTSPWRRPNCLFKKKKKNKNRKLIYFKKISSLI